MKLRDRTFQRLSLFLSYGLPLMKALELAGRESESGAMAKALGTVRSRLETGSTLEEAIRGLAPFRPHRARLALGEQLGLLDVALADIVRGPVDPRADFLRWLDLALPQFPVPRALAAASALLPPGDRRDLEAAEAATLAEAAARLPGIFTPPTAALLEGIEDEEFRRMMLAAAAKAMDEGRLPESTRTLRDALTRACSGLALLIRAGRPLTAALEAVASGLSHPKLASALKKAAERIAGGGTLTESLRDSGLFSPSMIEMVALAEECGSMEKALTLIAQGLVEGTFG